MQVVFYMTVDDSNCVLEAVNLIPGAFLHPNTRDFAEMCIARTTVLSRLDTIVCDTDVEQNVITVRSLITLFFFVTE